MPADMRPHVILQGFLGQREGLFLLSLVADNQCLHRECVAMGRVLAQNLICYFDTYKKRKKERERSMRRQSSCPFHLVKNRGKSSEFLLRSNPKPTLLMLFVFIVANHLAEQGSILGAQLLRHGGYRGRLEWY